MKIKADGQLRHRFWGDYSAVIVLGFDNAGDASLALPKLGPGWAVGAKTHSALVWVGDSDALNAVKEVLGSFGADVAKIDSIAKSIDYGEPFSVALEVDNPDQAALAF